MNKPQRTDLRRAGDWLSGEVEIQVSRMVLVAAGLALLALILIALD